MRMSDDKFLCNLKGIYNFLVNIEMLMCYIHRFDFNMYNTNQNLEKCRVYVAIAHIIRPVSLRNYTSIKYNFGLRINEGRFKAIIKKKNHKILFF